MGNWPSIFTNETYRAARPVEQINYVDVIGHNNWPNDKTVSADSFIGKMRARTGIATFNLPTEAQWECACRAGNKKSSNGLAYRYTNNSGSVSNYNEGPDCGTALVGSYPVNAWGFYDFCGNVLEMCLDAHASDSALVTLYEGQDPVNDPIGPPTNATARYHATRGGSWGNSSGFCSNYSRGYNNRNETGTRHRYIGMRVAVSPDWE